MMKNIWVLKQDHKPTICATCKHHELEYNGEGFVTEKILYRHNCNVHPKVTRNYVIDISYETKVKCEDRNYDGRCPYYESF